MRIIALLFLLAGLALAGGAVFYASQYFSRVEALMASQESEFETVRVIVAKEPLKYGDRLDFERVKTALHWVDWPKNAVPDGAFTKVPDLIGEDESDARVVLRAIEPGELVLKSKVSGFGESVRMSTQVADGMRAMTIPINAVTGGGGHISPGDHVDIEWTRRDGGQISSVIILQNSKVIATDQSADAERNRARVARTATVEVTPGDAQKLRVAEQAGTLALFLRGMNEVEAVVAEPRDLTDLPGVEAAAPPPEPEPEPEPVVEAQGYRVRVRKGANVEDVEIPFAETQ